MVELRAAGKTKDVGDQWELSYIFDGDRGFLSQRMVFINNDTAVSVVAWQHHQVVVEVQGLGGNGKVSLPFGSQIADLRRRTLVHMQRDFRIFVHKAFDHIR